MVQTRSHAARLAKRSLILNLMRVQRILGERETVQFRANADNGFPLFGINLNIDLMTDKIRGMGKFKFHDWAKEGGLMRPPECRLAVTS